MPKLVLTAEQAEQVRRILEQQAACSVGYIGCVNFAVERLTGEKVAELSFIALDWKDAVKICRLARKLSERSGRPRTVNPTGRLSSQDRIVTRRFSPR